MSMKVEALKPDLFDQCTDEEVRQGKTQSAAASSSLGIHKSFPLAPLSTGC